MSAKESLTSRSIQKKSNNAAASFFHNNNSKIHKSFSDLTDELNSSSVFTKLSDRDIDAIFTFGDWIRYRLDLFIAANPNSRFGILILATFTFMMIIASVWGSVKHNDELEASYTNFQDSLFMTYLVTTTGDYNIDIQMQGERLVYVITVFVGIIVIAVLIGIVTDTVGSAMSSLSSGKSKVIEKQHTLILGWNDSTPRLLCQIAFLRRVFRIQNETWTRRIFWWLRVLPSSPVALNKVVVLANTISKTDMEEKISKAFSEAKILKRRTKLGLDVIIREGDPTTTHDLLRVSAQNATSIAIMMTEVDEQEASLSNGRISNSATIRTVLALRNVMYSNGDPIDTFDPECRIIVQLQRSCRSLNAASFISPSGVEVMFPLDLHDFINTLLFKCISKPGLSRVISSLLDFECEAIRCRQATQVRGGLHHELGYFIGKTVRQAMTSHGWSNGVFIGVDSNRDVHQKMKKYNNNDTRSANTDTGGIVGDPSRIIEANDWLIFISPTSSPSHAYRVDQKKLKAMADAIVHGTSGNGRARRLSSTNFGSSNPKPQHILLCGWRPEWHTSPNSFRERIRSICDDLTPNSTITCLNITSITDFHKLMVYKSANKEEQGDEFTGRPAGYGEKSAWPVNIEACENDGDYSQGWRITEESGNRTFTIYHQWGDPVNYACMSWLFHDADTPPFDSAIVLGNVVGGNIPPDARDSRVLSILLILRELSSSCPHGSKKYENRLGMHVVVENCVDQTALLAICPKRTVLKGRSHTVGGTELDLDNTSFPPLDNNIGSNGEAELSKLRNSICESSSSKGDMTAQLEPWAPKVYIIEDEKKDEEVKRIIALLGGDQDEASGSSKLKSRMAGTQLEKGSIFSFTEVLIVRAEGESFNSAIFYKLKQGGWVHDYSSEHIGRRTIKVILEASSEFSVPEPDFVNNKAIVARTVAMNLAYPQIQESVMELVSTQAGTPEVELFSPEVLGIPLNDFKTTSSLSGGDNNKKTSLHFGCIQYMLDSLYVGYAVAIGYILAENGELVLSPSPSENIHWCRNDRIVVIIRHAKRVSSSSNHNHSSANLDKLNNPTKPKQHAGSLLKYSMKATDGDGSHALCDHHEEVATVVRMSMQPTASLEAVLEQQRRAALTQEEMMQEIKELKSQVAQLTTKV